HAASSGFVSTLDLMRRNSCPALADASVQAAVAYEPSSRTTIVTVRVDIDPPALRPHPSGLMLITCPSIVAAAACHTWPLKGAMVVMANERGAVELGYRCPSVLRGTGPFVLRVRPKEGPPVNVDVHRPTNAHLLVERPATLPN